MPAESRDAFFALRAFNVELASIKDGHNLRNQGVEPSSDPANNAPDSALALQLRLQWWRAAIGEIYDSSLSGDQDPATKNTATNNTGGLIGNLSISYWNSPVVRALAQAHAHTNFTHRFLERILDARELDLETNQYTTINELATYAEHTASSLLYLTLETCHVRDDAADHCVAEAGLGIGLTTALRATPYRLSTGGEVPVPAELLRPGFPYHQIVPTLLGGNEGGGAEEGMARLQKEDVEQWREAVSEIAVMASMHLAQARDQQSAVPKAARATLLPVVPTLHYLEKLEQAKYNLFDDSLIVGSKSDRLRLLFLLGRTWMTGVF